MRFSARFFFDPCPGSRTQAVGRWSDKNGPEITANNLDFLLPKTYPVAVSAVSQGDDRTTDQAQTEFTLTGYEEVKVAWHPEIQTVNGSLSASFSLVITNTGNLNTAFQISGDVTSNGIVDFENNGLVTIPANSSAVLLASVEVPQGGVYQIDATVQSGLAKTAPLLS